MTSPVKPSDTEVSQINSYLSKLNLAQGFLLAIVIVVGLAEIYTAVNQMVQHSWLAAALVNSLLALVVLYFFRRPSTVPAPLFLSRLFSKSIYLYIPAVVVVLFVVIASLFSGMSTERTQLNISWQNFAWVLWVPVVEELVFRRGIGGFFRQRIGVWWGSYFSVLVFAISHSMPTVERIFDMQVGLPLGPLLLAIFCELIYVSGGKILPAIALHAVCNGSIVVFSILDARWLEWLGFLYL